MCGIVGIADLRGSFPNDTLRRMTNALGHRGPDDSGMAVARIGNATVGFGHRRLSILDLSSASCQPMEFDGLTIAYNGEVYNFSSIRKELESAGYDFNSEGDTEVVLKAFHCWGIEAVNRFNGMFAIGLLDARKATLTLIRDRSGVKPLFTYMADECLLFASEVKSFFHHPKFAAEIDIGGVASYFAYGYVCSPGSMLSGVKKVRPGTFLTFSLHTGRISETTYWSVVDYYLRPRQDIDWEEAVSETDKLLVSACNLRMISDVPVGLFLSGGYDSSLVAAILQNTRSDALRTFTIGFDDERFDESRHAREIARKLGTIHVEYRASAEDFANIVPRIPEIWDEPIADQSVVPTYLVSQLARRTVSVSLSADGGDEIFGGYDKYENLDRLNRLLGVRGLRQPIMLLVQALEVAIRRSSIGGGGTGRRLRKTLAAIQAGNFAGMLESASRYFLPVDFDEFLRLEPARSPFLSDGLEDVGQRTGALGAFLAGDYVTYLADNILPKIDRATMSVSLEGREPLLDFRLIEFVATLPNEFKLQGKQRKRLLKEVAHRYLPAALLNRPKMGFAPPTERWLRNETPDLVAEFLSPTRLRSSGVYNVANVVSLRDRYLAGGLVDFQKVWSILILEMWREYWFKTGRGGR